MAQHKEASMADNRCFTNRNGHWNFHFIRDVEDCKIENCSSLYLSCTFCTLVDMRGAVHLCWIPSKYEVSEVKSFYKALTLLE